jgi:High potential iron-sulfur protein
MSSSQTPVDSTVTAPSNRREFFKKVLFYTSAGVVVQALAKSIAWAGDLAVIDMTGKKRKDADNTESVNIAKSLGYVPNLEAGLKAGKIKKEDKPGTAAGKVWKAAEQKCSNCQFYNYKKETPAKATCMLMQKVLVDSNGSCNSWAPNA